MKYVMLSIRFTIFMTILLGLIYPLAMTGVSHLLFPRQASGDFLTRGGQVVGSRLIGQKFESPKYFWSRPSAIEYNPLPSGGSNQGQASQDLKKVVDDRRTKLKSAHADQAEEPPQDLIFASASGLDPHISVDAANYQMQRVARVRNISSEQVQKMIEQSTMPRQFGILGEPTVNVLALNMALDQSQGIESAPILLPTAPAPETSASPTGPNETK